MLKHPVRAATAGALILMTTSCARPTALPERQRTGIGEFETRHWVHSKRLGAVMAVLERDTLSTWPQEVEDEYADTDAEKADQAFDEARTLAGRLASSTPSITAAVKAIRMSEGDRRAFVAQVDTLRDQAQRLNDAAEAGNIDRMRLDLKSIMATCRSCHERFREFTKPLEPRSKS